MATPPSDGQPIAPAIHSAPTPATLQSHVSRAAGKFHHFAEHHPALNHVPGRSLTLVGAGGIAAAILLSALPWFSGVGLPWSVVMLIGAAIVAAGELRRSGAETPVRLPARLQHPLVAPAYAALVVLHAILLLRLGVVPLLWFFAAGLIATDQYRREARAPASVVHDFEPARAWSGYRRNVTAGVALCLCSLFLTWGQSSGYWTGGYSYNYAYRYDSSTNSHGYGYGYDYQPMQYYWAGWETSGRNQSFAIIAVALLLGLLLWAAARPELSAGRAFRSVGLAMGAALTLFWLVAAKDGLGAGLFLIGLGSILFAAHRIWRGEDGGRWDLEQTTARVATWRLARRS